MIERCARFPAALASRSQAVRLRGEIPALLAHPDWERPAPAVIWLHGRTVSKELDPGRYLRWIRAGIAACAIDLPGHGERLEERLQGPGDSLELFERTIPEIDRVVEALAAPEHRGVFDLERLAIGGMSAGGMATLRRLCDPHLFRCASVEACTGNLAALYHPEAGRPWPVNHLPERIAPLDPMRHLAGWRPVPLLALHSEADEVVPIAGMREFIGALRERYAAAGADAGQVRLVTWPTTGAPQEHSGFGRFANDAKNVQVEFFRTHLKPTPAEF
jgi:dienelactone hydrolase